ncbi:hypothetical protein A8C75_09015 [Marinobacterium aestuarii]|uniref:DUF4194 domain-containing protein n=1 Tax=Marinobacterium aestuarii TaxID=1821621 RepID=A0A1A9EYK8_9GAMM|nr:hypothetical protein [Marinobacterium aestuarii]ANG62609.1 hypothetical protein A8C75_09015 [Marinobacterium aestuarii]
MSGNIELQRLRHLAELFKLFNGGKHLNRLSDAALWAELEQEQEVYTALFQALGYELCVDGRGFAWFHSDDLSPTVSNQSRQLALLFMVIFDTQADAGKALNRCSEWRVERSLMEVVFDQHQDLLVAEGLDADTLLGLLDKAETFGFARRMSGHWELLPAVCRYLDHFEALAEQAREQATALDTDLDESDSHNTEIHDSARTVDNDENKVLV